MAEVEAPRQRRADLASAGLLLVFAAVHMALALRFPLAPDETYYWEWSRRPAWGYYDQGPMVAWWIRASCALLGDTALGVRAGIIAACSLTQVLLWLTALRVFGSRTALLSVVLSGVTPMALAGGFIATYDPLVVLFWAAAAYCAVRALLDGSRWWWVGMGVAFGLGLLSKHSMALFAPCLLLAMAARPAWRRWLLRPEPWLALALACAIVAPHVAWQGRHDWMTFRHLFVLADKGTDRSLLRRLGDFVGSQVGLLSPVLFVAMVCSMVWAARAGRREPRGGVWLLFALGAPVLVVFLLMVVKAKVQANWAVAGWLTPPILCAGWLSPEAGATRARRWTAWAGIAVCVVLSAAIAWPEGRAALGLNVPVRWDQMNKLYGGPELARAVDLERARMERATSRRVVAGSATYDTASRLAFYLPDRPAVRCFFLGTRLNSYVLWNDEAGLRPGDDAIVADDRPPTDPELPAFHAIFERVEPVPEPVAVMRPYVYREPVRTYYLYRCFGYRPDPRVERTRGG